MPRRADTRRRKLWVNIKVRGRNNQVLHVPREQIRDTLIAAIERGDYVYPSDWYVQIEWRNREFVPNKIGEFTEEMKASRISSVGWDYSILNYLRGK